MAEPQAPSQGNENPPAPPQEPNAPEPNAEVALQPEGTPPSPTNEEQPGAVAPVVPAADGYQLGEGIDQNIGTVFNKLGMTQDQAAGVVMMDQARAKMGAEAQAKAGADHIKSWGDVSETNLNLARRGMDHFDPTGELKTMLNESGMGNNPRVIEMFFQFGNRMEEGGFLPSNVNTPPARATETAHMWYPEYSPGGTKQNG